MLIHLAIHPQWREKCEDEIQRLVSRHVGDSTTSATLCEKLAAIPISAWDDELPILDACIRESQRLVFIVFLMRRSTREMEVEGKVVRRGDFLGYLLGDVHLNPEYYPEPHKYDPDRWLRPDPVPNTTFPFLGWGAGRHPCTGMKVARLEMKLTLAMLLTRYEYELVDEHGKPPKQIPVPDLNDLHQVCACTVEICT
jgi:cytochrome P450